MESNITRRANNSSTQRDENITREKRSGPSYDAGTIRSSTNSLYEEEEEVQEETQRSKPVKYRIGVLATLFLVILGATLDITELLLDLAGTVLAGVGVVIGYIKDFFAVIVIPAIFLILKVPFWKGKKAKKKMTAMVTSFLISLIPWAGAFLPETLIGVIVTIHLTRKEDEEGPVSMLKSIVRRKRR